MSAFEPEWTTLQTAMEGPETQVINGNRFVTGTLEGHPVVLFLSGVSMVNAAMTTQLAIDRFDLDAIVFSGIAGGVDPSLHIGDVVVAGRWGQYLDTIDGPPVGGRRLCDPALDVVRLPASRHDVHPQPDRAVRPHQHLPRRSSGSTWTPTCSPWPRSSRRRSTCPPATPAGECLSMPPQVVVGGNGVSGAAFVDNARLREWAFDTFEARVLDMESAAVAQVAYANEVPFIAFRSLSDLAGGGSAANEMGTFMGIAARNSAQVVRAFVKAMD